MEAARKNRHQQFVIDGKAVLLGVDGVSDFKGPHSRRHDGELYAFDILVFDGEDLRGLPLSGPDLFRAACSLGLEGLVSKSGPTAPISPDDQKTGSRSRTASTRPIGECKDQS